MFILYLNKIQRTLLRAENGNTEMKFTVVSRDKELIQIADKYKTLASGQEGGTAQRLNKASIDIARLAKLFV